MPAFVKRLALPCVQTDSEDLAMVAFVAKKILRIGYYEILDDMDDLSEENLVQFDHQKAMKTIF